jgi:hypothetical protein
MSVTIPGDAGSRRVDAMSQLRRAGGYVLKIINSIAGCLIVAGLVTTTMFAARADDDFAFTGTYTQNVPCKGDGTDPAAILVKISPQEITSNIGTCSILDKKQDGPKLTAHVECKFPAGPMVGDITFTPRPDGTVAFVDRDGTYNAILHRCPS